MTCNIPHQNLNAADLKINRCDNTCSISFSYPLTTLLVTKDNDRGYIKFKVDAEKSPSLTYGSSKYAAGFFCLFNGLIHNYGEDSRINAELIIAHYADSLGAPVSHQRLYICIPVIIQDGQGGGVLDRIMSDLSNAKGAAGQIPNANAGGLEVSAGLRLNEIQNFSVGKLIPESKYIVYVGPNILNNVCSGQTNTRYVVFNNPEAALTLSTTQANSTGLTDLKFTPFDTINSPPVGGFQTSDFVPSQNSMGDDIYIDCKPVITSNTKTENRYITTGPPNVFQKISLGDVLGKIAPFMFSLIGILIMWIMYKIGNNLYGPKCPGPSCPKPLPKPVCK